MSEDTKLLRRPLPPKTLPALRPSVPLPPATSLASFCDPLAPIQRKVTKDDQIERVLACTPTSAQYSETGWQAVPSPGNKMIVIPKGPDHFPRRPPRTWQRVHLLGVLQEDPHFYSLPEFTLNDFLEDPSSCPRLYRERLKQLVLSRHNYKKLIELFLAELHRGRQSEISTHVLSSESVPVATSRKPQKQIIYEIAALIREHARAQAGPEEEPVSQTEHDSSGGLMPGDRQAHQTTSLEYPGSEILLNSVTTRYFQGFRCSQSPFLQDKQHGGISPSELAILDCLVQGGLLLSLKAHFIARVPDLTPLAQTLLYLNLSFNDLSIFPAEVYDLPYLEVLKLRDNPIKEIPTGIHKLSRLKTFVMSFCLVSCLPLGLFLLPCLQFLDISYNLISSVPNDIKNLRALEYLNVEGNQLAALPCGALRLTLKQLRVTNNYMHPYFWAESTQNQPQRLSHLAALTLFTSHRRHSSLPSDIQQDLNNVRVCDCCQGPMSGPGLKLIRPCEKIFGVRKLPFLFSACSPSCYKKFSTQTTNLVQVLYGESSS